MQVIEITSLSGHSPYNISICDTTLTYCYVVATGVVSVPPTLQLTVPTQLEGANQVLVVATDSIGCEQFILQSCPGTPTPTPTLTPTPTQTRIIICNCVSFENTTSGTLSFSFTQCDGKIFNGDVQSGTTLYYCGRLPSAEVGVNIQINEECVNNTCTSVNPTSTPTPTPTQTLPVVVGYFQDSCDPLNSFVVSNIPFSYSPLSGVYYIQSSGFIGCATAISPIITSNLYSYILLNSQPDINTCQVLNPCPTPTPTPTLTQTPTQTPTTTPTTTPTQTQTLTPTPTSTNLSYNFNVNYTCLLPSSITVTILDMVGGTPPYLVGSTTFTSQVLALLNTNWIDANSIGYGVSPSSDNTYWLVARDSVGNILAKSVTTDCYPPTPTPTPTLTSTPTPTPTSTPTPTPTLIPLEEFIINAVGVNQIYQTPDSGFIINSSLTFKINWGDGNIETFPSGITRTNHIYSSPYTGPIKILSTDLTRINTFTSNTFPHNSQSLWTSTSELQKLDGLLNLTVFNANGLFITGNVLNLPRSITYLTINNNNLSGNTSNLPQSIYNMSIYGSNTISGDTSGFPVGITSQSSQLALGGNNTVSGNTSNLPRVTGTMLIYGQNTISGDTSGLPSAIEIRIQGQNTISGDVLNLPVSLLTCQIDGSNTISGDVLNLPPSIRIAVFGGDNIISGNTSNFPRTLRGISISGYNTITGDVSTLPPNLTSLTFRNKTNPILVTIFGDIGTLPSTLTNVFITSTGIFTGDLYNIPLGITYFNLTSNITFSYSSGRVWANNFTLLIINPIIGSWTGFNSTETDNLLIDIQPKYINTSSNFTIKCGSTPKRTSASDTAYNALVALIGASNVVLT